jgi:preprotein translocase subunit SecG
VILAVAIVQVASMILMVGLVLMHSGKGGGLSDMFGGGGGAALGSTAAERNLNRITVVVALVFSFTTVGLGLLMD